MFPTLITYFTTIVLLIGITLFLGWRLGQSRQRHAAEISPRAAGIFLALVVLWFVTSKLARSYADTDGFGAELAEWFAHSGRWLALLGAMMFGHGWICGTGQTPKPKARRIFYFVAVWGMAALVISRTVPVYFLLGDGRRDTNGCLRQSKQVEATCGAVALLNYLERYAQHTPLTEREVSRVCGVTEEGTTTSALVKAARYFGQTNATAQVLTLAELEKSRLPAIVSISTLPTVHHATLLIKLDNDRAYFIDPAYGFWDVTRARFQEIWYGKTVLLK